MEEYKPASVFDQNDLNHMQQPLPNAKTILILGILGLVVCGICGIVAFFMANTELKLYESNPSMYTQESYSNVKTGRILGIVSLALMALGILIFIVSIGAGLAMR